jgi:hypothetical protein
LPWLCEGELEKCSKFIVKDYNMDKKIWKGKARVEKSCVIVGLSVKMFKIYLKTQFASHIILFQGNF